MAEINRTAASLRFFGDDLVPEEITRLLGSHPSDIALKGAPREWPNGKSTIAKTGKWLRKVPDRVPGDLSGQIRELTTGLTEDLAIWRDLSRRFEGNIFIGLFMANGNEGCDLSPDILSLLSDRGLSLQLDVYGPFEIEEVDTQLQPSGA